MNVPHFVLLEKGKMTRLGIDPDIPAPGSTFGPPNRALYLETRVPPERKRPLAVGHYPYRAIAMETEDLAMPVLIGFYSTPPKERHINLFRQHPGGLDAPVNQDVLRIWHEKNKLHVENLSDAPLEVSPGRTLKPGAKTAVVSGDTRLILPHHGDPTISHFLSLESVNRIRALQVEQLAVEDIKRERKHLELEGETNPEKLPSDIEAHTSQKRIQQAEKTYQTLPFAKKVIPVA